MGVQLTRWEWVFLLVAGMLAAAGVFYPASIYGAGVSSDSAFYLACADSFAAGAGFIDFKGDPLIDFPPLYSAILGGLHRLTGVPTLTLGLAFNMLVMAALVVSTGVLLRRCLPERRLWFYLGVLLTLVFLPLYTLAANIATDLFYILLTLWFCLAAQSFLASKRLIWLVVMTVIATLCALLRWIGLAVVASQFLLVLLAYRGEWKKGALYAVVSSGLAFIPAALWIGVHNVLMAGTAGRAGVNPGMVSVLGNLQLTAARMLAWTAPNPLTMFLPVALAFLLAILLLNRRPDYQRWLSRLGRNPLMPVILVTGVYFVAVTLTGYTGDHLESFDDRYQAPLYYFILLLLFVSLDELIFSHLRGRALTAALALVVAVFAVWGAYRLDLLVSFARASRGQGVVPYNTYNTQKLLRSGLVTFLQQHPFPPGAAIYTNETEALYLLLHRQTEMAPYDLKNYSADPARLPEDYPSWPPEGEAYLVWFKPNIKRHHFSPRDLKDIAELKALYKERDGEIYLVRPQP